MVKFWCLAALNRCVYPTPFNRNGCVEGWQLPCLYGFLMKLGGFPRPGELWGLLHNSVYHPVFRDGQLWRVMAKSRNKQSFRKDMPKFYGLLAALLCCHMTSHPFRLFWRQQSSTIIYPKYAASIHQNKHHLTRRFWKIQTSNRFIPLGPKMINSNSSALFSKVSIFFQLEAFPYYNSGAVSGPTRCGGDGEREPWSTRHESSNKTAPFGYVYQSRTSKKQCVHRF